MTAPERALAVGMRVVVRDGPWPTPRIAGHYGKVSGVAGEGYGVDITGHVDGGAIEPIMLNDPLMQSFWADELEVVD